jgi:hypothetical protein
MKLTLLLLSTVGYISFLSRQRGLGIYRAPFLFCCTVTLVLYGAAMIGHLSAGCWLMLAIGLGLVILEALQWWQARRVCSARTFALGGIFLLPFVWWYLAIDSRFQFLLWDEFSFWASSAKIIYETNALFNADSPIFLKSYPPGQQLFQYYLTKLSGWTEKNVLYAQSFWLLSGLLCIAGSLVRRPINIAVTFLLSCVLLYYFEYSFSSIYSDALLGIFFGACLVLALNPDRSFMAWAGLTTALATLILIKEIALLLMLIAWALYAMLGLFKRMQVAGHPAMSVREVIARSLGCLLLVLATQRSWSWYVSQIGGARQETAGLIEKLSAIIASGRLEQTWLEFLLRIAKPQYLKWSLFDEPMGPSIWLALALLMTLAIWSIRKCLPIGRFRMSVMFVTLYAGGLAYVGILFFSYLVFFSEYEGVRLASFERYLSTYVLAIGVITFASYMSIFDAKAIYKQRLNQLIVTLFVLLLAPPLFFIELKQIQSVGSAATLRRDIEVFAAEVKQHIKPGEKTYFVAQNTNGLERTMFYYAMLPNTIATGWCWSFGQKYFEGDVWTCDKKLPELIQGYDYLAVYYADAQFWRVAGDLFEPQAKGLPRGVFKINLGAVGTPLFTQLK